MENKIQNQNPLLIPSALPYGAAPFNEIKPEHFIPALKWAIEKALNRIGEIKSNSDSPDFDNTILALETASEEVTHVSTIYYNLHSADATEQIEALAQEVAPLLSEFSSDISLDLELFERVKAVYARKDDLNLNTEQLRLLQNTYDDFSRNGALLNDEQKASLRDIDKQLSLITPRFSENILKATNAFALVVDKEEDLIGLPESSISNALHTAAEMGEEDKWVFTLQMPSLIPFMTYCPNRDLREAMWRASATRAYKDEYSNHEHVKQIATFRKQRAQLLGFETHADFVLKKRMAETPERVHGFLKELIDASMKAARAEFAEIEAFAQKTDGIAKLKPWDISYYIEKLKKEKFDFDDEELRPYFQLEKVIDGAFLHAEKLYGITFRPIDGIPGYHKDVKVYEAVRVGTDEFVGLFYTDFFPRKTKRNGAWMTSYKEQGLIGGKVQRPHISIVCNFTPSQPGKPSLLTFNEVQTLFHEFGHALHGLLSNCTYQSLGGTNVYWDFVELPSQILENWTMEKEALDLFARHHETGEALPKELTDKIRETSQFMAGYYSVRQLTFGTLDMAWHHNKNPEAITDVEAFEKQATESLRLLDPEDGTCSSCAFSHIFAGGYSAGYYSYKWAEVLDADAFELFKEKGLFNKDVAQSFHDNILSRGGTEHPMELYKKFRGREPDPKALLRREGLI